MRRVVRWMVAGAAVILLLAGAKAQTQKPLGTILEIVPPVTLKTKSGGKVVLRAARDTLRLVYDGESIECGASGKVRLWLNGEMITRRGGEGELQVQAKPQGKADGAKVLGPQGGFGKTVTPERRNIAEARDGAGIQGAIENLGRAGGTRGGGAGIYSPADGGAVRLERLEIRWVGGGKKGTVTLRIETEDGVSLWSASPIDATAGKVLPALNEGARKAVGEYRAAGGAASFTLTMVEENGSRYGVMFHVLTKQSEEELARELAEWDKEGDVLLRVIGRAYVLDRKRLYTEAAEEYEAALKVAPESESLLQAAMDANTKTGNTVRAGELRRRLAVGK